MSVRCAKCGEELLGAVNRCWKCGQAFALRSEADGRPPIREAPASAAEQPLDAVVLDDAALGSAEDVAVLTARLVPPMRPPVARPRPLSTAELVDARRTSAMAMGGTVASLTLGIFALAIAPFWFWAAFIGLLGLVMGIWGLYSPRRRLAFFAMLLCCLGIGLGSLTGVIDLRDYLRKNQPLVLDEEQPDSLAP